MSGLSCHIRTAAPQARKRYSSLATRIDAGLTAPSATLLPRSCEVRRQQRARPTTSPTTSTAIPAQRRNRQATMTTKTYSAMNGARLNVR